MKITLFTMDKIKEFILPTQISGSFSFDEDEAEEAKLINIEARDGKWVIYSNDFVSVISNGNIIDEEEISDNLFYILKRDNNSYLIYISNTVDKTIDYYSFNKDLNIVIGNTNDCNIIYRCPFISNLQASITYNNNYLLLQKNNSVLIYINNIVLKTNQYYIKNGDVVNISGLKLMFFNGIVLINNPGNCVTVNMIAAKLNLYSPIINNDFQNIEIKDKPLYDRESYFSKSPRIRRIIEKKDIRVDSLPGGSETEDMPLIYTLGPMFTMGIVSVIMLVNTVTKIIQKTATLQNSWTSLVTALAMILSTMFWPILTKNYNKKLKARKRKELEEKYDEYLKTKSEELRNEQILQKEIILENLVSSSECINMIQKRNMFFWDKRIEQNDFLDTRVGIGDAKLDINVIYPEEGFTIDENELKKKADKLIEDFKYIKNVPIKYSFYKNKLTAVMGSDEKQLYFMDGILLQLLTFYSYEDLKIVVFSNDDNKKHWEYVKYLNHNFSNDKTIRFFATDQNSIKNVTDYLNQVLSSRLSEVGEGSENKNLLFRPHYFIVIDSYDDVKNTEFMKNITEIDQSFGFSLVILEKKLSKLPSKCSNFIQLGDKTSSIMENSLDMQEIQNFIAEISYNIDMLQISKILSNIPIEFENNEKKLPESISFLEMEKVGKVEQLNILNRWNTNNSTVSLKAEVGVGEDSNLMYLDLHEKYHGPHGLIAGTTGSGKSEFIITYILSLSINYSPDDVNFVLIDYKGGGLALAFDNKKMGLSLPHLAGTITNLDKALMDRTLVSIDSEVKRRQKLFNDAREKLGESTIDIYKYQQLFKDGKLDEALPHLLIICDEFAELKQQQPDFMDNLISIARIGRSLGVHLILATQKPSGVVNDQIWSNSKFKVCLKVQDAADSKEMLKKEDAASIKEAGRFYLQVGYDEYYALGQSAWCGAAYYPTDVLIKQTDKSINIIDDSGSIIKSIQSGNKKKVKQQGDQITAILENVVAVSEGIGKKAKKLWLDSIDEVILIDDLIRKYNYKKDLTNLEAVIGEYDAPESQQQGLLLYSFLRDGNTVIFGNDGSEREMLLSSIIYSTSILYTGNDINYYIIDLGSESLRKIINMPQVGDMAFIDDEEKINNLIKLIDKKMKERKKLFIDYGGEFKNYQEQNENSKLPIISVIINNYDTFIETYQNQVEEFIKLYRDSVRYGIVFILTGTNSGSVGRRVMQHFSNSYALRLNDSSEYYSIFNTTKKVTPREIYGRGIVNNGGLHEFQTASIFESTKEEVQKLNEIANKLKETDTSVVEKIPSLPKYVDSSIVKNDINSLKDIPIGVNKETLNIEKFDFTTSYSTIISSNKVQDINYFIESLVDEFVSISKLKIIVLDLSSELQNLHKKVANYFSNDFDKNFKTILDYFNKVIDSKDNTEIICIIHSVSKLKTKLSDQAILSEFTKTIKKSENIHLVLIDDSKKLKSLDYENWYSDIKSNTDGVWVGKGLADQNIFRVSPITKEMMKDNGIYFGYTIKDGTAYQTKMLNFYKVGEDDLNGE